MRDLKLEELHKKYERIVKQVIKESDIVVEVVDARFPLATRNRRLEKLAEKLGKKILIVINKADLVPRRFVELAKNMISGEYPCVYLSAQKRHGTRKLWNVLNKLAAGRKVVVGIVGYPNVGKSMIINILKGKHSARTSPIPGFTKGKMLVKIARNTYMMDTPGVVYERNLKSMLLKGAIGEAHFSDAVPAAHVILQKIKEVRPEALKERYNIEFDEKTTEEILEEIARKYHMLKKGGKLDLDRAARRVINDYIKGKLRIWWL